MFQKLHIVASGALACVLVSSCAKAQTPSAAPSAKPDALTVEAEDFAPQGKDGWRAVKNGEGNYMVDIIGFQHISGERVLQAPRDVKNAVAIKDVLIPSNGAYRVWSRFEQPTGTENRFRVEIRQNGKTLGAAVMGEKDAPKYFFGSKTPVGQYDASWGSEGLVEQSFDVQGLQAGPATMTLTALDQSTLAPVANRNVDLLFLTTDLQDTWRNNATNSTYPILDAALRALPPRYYLRLTSPAAGQVALTYIWNRIPWSGDDGAVTLAANVPSAWLPLRNQDVSHFTTLRIQGAPVSKIRAELASAPDERSLLRAIDWSDAASDELLIGLPPYPSKYPDEKIVTVEEQYRNIAAYLKAHPSKVGREPTLPLAWGGYLPVWRRGRMGDAAADLYHQIGMRVFLGFVQPEAPLAPSLEVARERFRQWGMTPSRSIAIGSYRLFPTPENIAKAKKFAADNAIGSLVQRFDYGDEIQFSEWLGGVAPEQLQARFADWQRKYKGKVEFGAPDSSAKAAAENPALYVDSRRFFEDFTIEHVARQAREIPKQMGGDVLFGANVAAHPFYYPEIAKYIKWFRKTESGDYAANFGRHSEYFWQIGQPGPLINAYVADHFRAGMRDNPQAVNLQYTMPHSPGNTDASFRRSAFSHLAHGARGLDYFGIGLNHSFTENYIDFRDPLRFAAIRDINRSMATVEDILPHSRVLPSRIALILSESTEHWDFAGIATDKGGAAVFADDYKKMRLAYHQERVGMYYALVHGSRSPDLMTEDDVQNGLLKNYDVAYWVGDCAQAKTVGALQSWVNSGGDLVATAGALRFDEYKKPQDGGLKLLGLQSAKLDAKTWFFRPQIELPHLQPLDFVGAMPALALRDAVTPAAGAKVVASFKSGAPAIIEHAVGKGKTRFIAALPGVAYLWSAYQPAPVPSRGPSSHMELTRFAAATRDLIIGPAQAVQPHIETPGSWVDARLLQAPQGRAIALSNYSPDPAAEMTLVLRGVPNVRGITSAARGPLKLERHADGSVRARYAPGLGDILRLEGAP